MVLHEPDHATPDHATPVTKTIRALEEALKYGDIDSIGLSNVDLRFVKMFLKNCDLRTRKSVKYVQNEFHFLNQSDSQNLIPYLASHNISYVAFSPLAGGLLTGKYLSNKTPPPGSRLQLRPEPYKSYQTLSFQLKIQNFIAEARATGQSPESKALQFILGTNGISAAVIGPRRKEHYENFGFKFSRSGNTKEFVRT